MKEQTGRKRLFFLFWSVDKKKTPPKKKLMLPGDMPRRNRRAYLLHKERARRLIAEKLKRFNLHYQFAWSRVSVRNQRSRWGSCSMKGGLNFSYRIIFLSETLQDYLIVHELCHLKEFTHSKSFYALVAETIPDWRHRRRELKKII
jgi:predicted metal-dependent hydrolase